MHAEVRSSSCAVAFSRPHVSLVGYFMVYVIVHNEESAFTCPLWVHNNILCLLQTFKTVQWTFFPQLPFQLGLCCDVYNDQFGAAYKTSTGFSHKDIIDLWQEDVFSGPLWSICWSQTLRVIMVKQLSIWVYMGLLSFVHRQVYTNLQTSSNICKFLPDRHCRTVLIVGDLVSPINTRDCFTRGSYTGLPVFEIRSLQDVMMVNTTAFQVLFYQEFLFSGMFHIQHLTMLVGDGWLDDNDSRTNLFYPGWPDAA